MSGDRNSAIGTLTVLQGRSLGYARDDGAKRYQNFAALIAALRSFDSVLLFQIIYFLTYDVFLRSG